MVTKENVWELQDLTYTMWLDIPVGENFTDKAKVVFVEADVYTKWHRFGIIQHVWVGQHLFKYDSTE